VTWWVWVLAAIAASLVGLAVHDVLQREHAVLRNYPVVGHLRYWLEGIGPELRQYIITDNDGDRPFSRDQRRWIYTTAKQVDPSVSFGSDNDLDLSPGHLIVKQTAFPLEQPRPGDAAYDPDHAIACEKVLGRARGRARAFRMPSVVNISGMSYGSLGERAVEALNRGAALAGCLQTTGEGGLTPFHAHGGELVWQIGTGYFGCRDSRGRFDLSRFCDVVAAHPVRAVEIKLSQGAKAGLGGILPAAKVTPEIAEWRGVPPGVDCISPASHREFTDADSMLDFVELLAEHTGLPVGIKSAVGDGALFTDLARLMAGGDRGVDFVTVDGGEGGTGAGPLTFTDHVGLPFLVGFPRVRRAFEEAGVADDVVFVGSGRLGLPERALAAFALGCDAVNVGREAMLSIGCIQAMRCHTNRCPTGVTTNSRWRQRGLDPTLKSVRAAHYLIGLRRELLWLSRACGADHPSHVDAGHIEVLGAAGTATPLARVVGHPPKAAGATPPAGAP